ncbi:hypothetical protein N7493_000780 [Penicillium malachiteum]|uniref:Uncharacterized protein n=1 Tax=Penicillium malachiteum TaxID=1324776 RepID=A0AAD6N137_9EURO|nr:hypothetical protein N7493_000780 [Penicillium malachiteum]
MTPGPIEQKNFDIVTDFLQPDSQMTVAKAAFQINELTPMKQEARGEEGEIEEPQSYLREMWAFLSIICKQIPHEHPSQDKLVSLIRELKLLPSEEFTIGRTGKALLWADLPWIAECWYDEWDGLNFFAFSARLLQSGFTGMPNWLTHSVTTRWFSFVTTTMSYALEDEISQSNTCTWETRDYQICAAAQWVEYSREAIFQKVEREFLTREPKETETADQSLSLYKGGVSFHESGGIIGKQDSVLLERESVERFKFLKKLHLYLARLRCRWQS